jgi:hypothetical protein
VRWPVARSSRPDRFPHTGHVSPPKLFISPQLPPSNSLSPYFISYFSLPGLVPFHPIDPIPRVSVRSWCPPGFSFSMPFEARVKSVLSGDTVVLSHVTNPSQERLLSLAYVSAPRLRREGDEVCAELCLIDVLFASLASFVPGKSLCYPLQRCSRVPRARVQGNDNIAMTNIMTTIAIRFPIP